MNDTITVDMRQIRADHALTQARAETRSWEPFKNRMGTSWHQGHRAGYWDGVRDVLEAQARWEALTEAEAIAELGKGPGSIYHPLFADDPRIWADCPRDGRTTVGPEGLCDHCLYDFTRTP